jgi:hypothetical protein
MVVDGKTGAFDDIKALVMDQMPFGNDFPKLIDCVLFDETEWGKDAFSICSVASQGRISCQLRETSSLSISVSRCLWYVTD